MKRIWFLFGWLIIPVVMHAQDSAVDKLFAKYNGREGITSVTISSKMFEMFSEMETGDPEFEQAVKGLKGIRILACEGGMVEGKPVNFFTELMQDLPLERYEEMMVVKEKDQNIRFLVREENGRMAELLMVVGGGSDNVLISITGEIDMKSISKLSKSLQIKGLDKLDHMEE
ncbi:MAG TPA: DUF4252 domain-containing protein [Bacteroidetes bacterium]|nr:DUF4252 domain-containing protein [Bacteroidota bacterium]